jgi:phosphonate transport system ATP-binding protein
MMRCDESEQPVIQISRLTKTFSNGSQPFRALDDVSLDIQQGQMVALIGASGSGKSTLLRHISGLALSDGGDTVIKACGSVVQRSGRLAFDIRATRSRIGFVFQQFNIVNRLSVLNNVLAGALGRIPSWRGAVRYFSSAEKKQALDALKRVGMGNFAHQRASSLSGGQQQRVAIARTLMQQSSVILADEPIASLDPVSARNVMETLSRINREDGTTVVVSLHQVDYALRYCERTVALSLGRITFDGPSSALDRGMLCDIYGDKCDETGLCGDPSEEHGDVLPDYAAASVALGEYR